MKIFVVSIDNIGTTRISAVDKYEAVEKAWGIHYSIESDRRKYNVLPTRTKKRVLTR
jgi:hypothetical protein